MKKYVLIAALAAALISLAAATPNRADAMTISAPAGMLSAVDQVAQTEQVRWLWGFRHHSRWGYRPWGWGYRPLGYYRSCGYWTAWGYRPCYRPWGYRAWGWRRHWGWRRW